GQMPIHMRMRKLRGPHMKKSMPFEPFRTHTQAVNLQDLERRFDAGEEVTLDALKAKGLGTRKDVPVKVLAKGTLSKKLTVHAHAFSGGAIDVSAWSRATSTPASSGTRSVNGAMPGARGGLRRRVGTEGRGHGRSAWSASRSASVTAWCARSRRSSSSSTVRRPSRWL